MSGRAALAALALLTVVPLSACEAAGSPRSGGAGRAEGAGDALAASPEALVVLRDGVQAAPGTRVIAPGVGDAGAGWYAALDLGDAAPREVAAFYREHLAALGFAVEAGGGPLTVVGTRAVGPTTRVRVDVVPTSGEVPGFARLVADR